MQIHKLDHVNVQTAQLNAMIQWYREVLGLRCGKRPNFGFPGAWMYTDETVVVQLVGINRTATGSKADLKLEHFAFTASDAASFEKRLLASDTEFRKVFIADNNTVAFNLWDPDGNHIHVDFPADE